jgi:hypothetical protein
VACPDLLIHEATFDDSLAADAVAKRHSTTHEAVDVARRMRARVTILTHLSQRYAKVPGLRLRHAPSPTPTRTKRTKVPVFDFDHAPATAIAFDQMCVRRKLLRPRRRRPRRHVP